MHDRLWRCADGRVMFVGEMTDSHLHNAIAKIQRSGWRREFLDRLLLEETIRRMGLTSRRFNGQGDR